MDLIEENELDLIKENLQRMNEGIKQETDGIFEYMVKRSQWGQALTACGS